MKTLLFDLDNTLYDYDSAHEHAIKTVYDTVSEELNIDEEQFKKLYREARAEVKRELVGTASSNNRVLYFQRLYENSNNTIESEKVLQLYKIYWDTLLENAVLLDGAIELLEYLRKSKIKIGIVTNLTTHIQLRKLKALGINEYIDVLVTSEEAGSEKPNNTPFLLGMHKLESLAKDCMFVGDNPKTDVEGANALGMKTVRLMFGAHASDEASSEMMNADYTVNSLREIIDILEQG